MCGINVDGESHFRITPRPGGHFTFAKASYNSIYGEGESGWDWKDGTTVYTVTVLANCTAEILLPGKKTISVCSGRYEYTVTAE